MFPTLASPVIFAHRGASSHAPENTLSSFQLALDQGSKAIEFDVRLTKDREVVVFHDAHLNRTTDGTGRIKDKTLSEIRNLNAGITFSPAYQNERIPTLSEVFESIPQEALLNIELKNLDTPFDDLPLRVASVIQNHNAHNRVLISSYNSIALTKFHREISSIPRGFLLQTSLKANFHSSFPYFLRRIQSIHLSFKSLNPQIVTSFKRAGKQVYCYTLNHAQDMLSALKMGIDGFFTDDPGFAIRILVQNGLIQF